MELQDFKQFDVLFTGTDAPFVSRKIDADKQPFLMSTCVLLQVRQETVGKLFYKVSFDGDFRLVDMTRSRRLQEMRWPSALPTISKDLLPISKAKHDDLISLLPFLPSICHSFYKELRTSTNSADYPQCNDGSISDEMN